MGGWVREAAGGRRKSATISKTSTLARVTSIPAYFTPSQADRQLMQLRQITHTDHLTLALASMPYATNY